MGDPTKIEEPGSGEQDLSGGDNFQFTVQAVQNARWEYETETEAGEKERAETELLENKKKAFLVADAMGFPGGTSGKFTVFEKTAEGKEEKVTELQGSVKEELVEAEWEYEFDDESDHETPEGGETGFAPPEYYFEVEVEEKKAKSGIVTAKVPPQFIPSM